MTIVFLTIFIMNQILIYISELIITRLLLLFVFYCKRITVVKELRSKMFGQHPGYFKAVFLKKKQIIIVSIYEYTVLPRSIVPVLSPTSPIAKMPSATGFLTQKS
jgi:hypothetical protein